MKIIRRDVCKWKVSSTTGYFPSHIHNKVRIIKITSSQVLPTNLKARSLVIHGIINNTKKFIWVKAAAIHFESSLLRVHRFHSSPKLLNIILPLLRLCPSVRLIKFCIYTFCLLKNIAASIFHLCELLWKNLVVQSAFKQISTNERFSGGKRATRGASVAQIQRERSELDSTFNAIRL